MDPLASSLLPEPRPPSSGATGAAPSEIAELPGAAPAGIGALPDAAPSNGRSLDRQIFYLHALAQISRTLAAVGTLERLLFQVADYFTEVAGVRWTCVYLRDPRTDRYRLHESKLVIADPGWSPPEIVQEDAVADAPGTAAPQRVGGTAFGLEGGCWLLPLFTEGASTGFLLFGDKVAGGEILADEREFLSTLATQAAVAMRHVLLLDETARMVEELTVLNEVSRIFTLGHDAFHPSLQAVWNRLQPFLRLEWGLLVPVRPGGEERPLGEARLDEADRQRIGRWCALLLSEGERGAQLRRGEVVLLDAGEVERSFPAEFRPPQGEGRGFALVPAFYDQELDSVLLLRAHGDRARLQGSRRLLQHLSPALSSALQTSRDHVKLERLATTDGLTSLYNHRYFHERLQQEYLRAYRLRDRVGLLFVDVDHFKSINDAFGHLYGDQVLARIAEVLRVSVREIDIVARYGGEEFAIILPEATCEEAAVVAERVRYAVEQMLPLRFERKTQRLTVSVGAASYPETAASEQELVEAADRALYQAKGSGRNRVTVAAGDDRPPATSTQ